MKYLITFSYDGSKYYGYQKQPNKNSIQIELERALTLINSKNKVTINASGRTDSGVHALNQKADFVLLSDIPCDKLKRSINRMLPPSIYVKNVERIKEDFHARFDVYKKEYTYKINTGEYNPLFYDYVYQYNKELDVDRMKKAAQYFIGEHDFTSYAKDAKLKESCIRTIYKIDIIKNKDIIDITFVGSGFLRYMVRNMVGSLIEVGNGTKKPSDISKIIKSKDRKAAGITAPACGLYLSNVYYK